MRSALLVLVAMVFTCSTAFAQVEQGNIRIGGNFTGAFYENATLYGIEGQVGYVAHPNFEFGGLAGYVNNDIDVFGISLDLGGSFRAGGYAMIHFKPATKFNPGIYFAVAKQTGDFNPVVIDVCGKFDLALGEKALLHFGAGLEWAGDVDYGIVTLSAGSTFYIRAGIAGLLGK